MKMATFFVSLLLSNMLYALSVEHNQTQESRVEIIITVAGMQESVDAITKSSQQLITLTRQLSNKKEFSSEDQKVITALAQALNNNADAINNIAQTLPNQFDQLEGGAINLLQNTQQSVEAVIKSSKNDLIDPTLSRIENRLLIFVVIVSVLIFALLGFIFWRVQVIAATGSETVGNIMSTIKSLEKVLEKVQVEK